MKIKSLLIVAAAAIGFTACSDAWLEDYKLDQNRPSEVTMAVLLPSAQAGCGMLQGDVLPRLTSIFMQQMTRHGDHVDMPRAIGSHLVKAHRVNHL
jgi:hypothetical protein